MLLRPGEYSEAASELIICCKKAFSACDLPESSGEDDLEADDAPELMDVLVDTLLSLLPQSSAPVRSSIEQVRIKNMIFVLYSFIIVCQVYYSTTIYCLRACPYVASCHGAKERQKFICNYVEHLCELYTVFFVSIY